MWKKLMKILLLGMSLLLIFSFKFSKSVIAQINFLPKYGIVADFHQFAGFDFSLELEGNNLSDDGHATNQTTSLKLSNDKVLKNTDFILVDSSKELGRWKFDGNLQEELFLETPLNPGVTYQVIQDIAGDKKSVAYFKAEKGDSSHIPPTIYASSRTVKKDDSTFNIMDGVSARDSEGHDLTSKITHKGNVDIGKEGTYKVIYSVTDSRGLSAIKSINIKVQESSISLEPPVLNQLTDTDTIITGSAKYLPNTKVYVVLGTVQETYRTETKEDGTFSIPLEKTYPKGTSITAYIMDDKGNKSAEVYGVVQGGKVIVGIDQILSSDKTVTGHTSPGASVEVAVKNNLTREHIYKGIADSTGKYSIYMNGQSYPAGTKVTVTATLDGVSGSQSVVVYPKKVSIDTVSVGSNIISGDADPNATVYLKVNSKEYKFTANAAGSFYGTLGVPLHINDQITAYQISNDIQSDITTLTVT